MWWRKSKTKPVIKCWGDSSDIHSYAVCFLTLRPAFHFAWTWHSGHAFLSSSSFSLWLKPCESPGLQHQNGFTSKTSPIRVSPFHSHQNQRRAALPGTRTASTIKPGSLQRRCSALSPEKAPPSACTPSCWGCLLSFPPPATTQAAGGCVALSPASR